MDRVGLVNDNFALVRAGDSDHTFGDCCVTCGLYKEWIEFQALNICTIKDLSLKVAFCFNRNFCICRSFMGMEFSCLQS